MVLHAVLFTQYNLSYCIRNAWKIFITCLHELVRVFVEFVALSHS